MDVHQASSEDRSSRSKREAEELTAELCINCEDSEVKQVIQKYQYGQSIGDIESKMKKGACSNLPHLTKTLKFLNNSAINDPIPKKKDDIVHDIVCRMQNLLPDDCAFCKTRYKLEFMEKPILQCSKCCQSAHKPCIIKLIQEKTHQTIDTDSDISQEEVLNIINPLSFPGLYYLCKACEVEHIATNVNTTLATEDPADVNSEQTDNTQNVSSSVTESGGESAITTEQSPVPSPTDEPPAPSPTDEPSAPSPTDDTTNTNSSASHTNDNKTIEKKDITCRFFKKGTCRHGAKGEECKFTHPELCKKFTQHGTRQPRGCNKGSHCKYLHPQMCMNSLRKGICLSQSCRYRHIKGTTRHKADGETNAPSHTTPANKPEPESERPTSAETENTTSAHPQNAQKQAVNTDHFLDVIRQMKAEILAEMDKKIGMVSQMQAHHQPMFYPPHKLPTDQPTPQLPHQMLLQHHQQIQQQQHQHQLQQLQLMNQHQQQTRMNQPRELMEQRMLPPQQIHPITATTINKSTQQQTSLPINRTEQAQQQQSQHQHQHQLSKHHIQMINHSNL